MPRDSITHDGVHEWRAFHVDPNGETSEAILQAAYDAGLDIGRQEVEAVLGMASTTPEPRRDVRQTARSIWDDWSPSCDE